MATLELTHAQFTNAAKDIVSRRLPEVSELRPHSPEFYFLNLLQKGAETREKGNYGIAASLIIRQSGQELIFFGANNLISGNNPHGHAEMNALQNARETFTRTIFDDHGLMIDYQPRGAEDIANVLTQKIHSGQVISRNAPDQTQESLLFTTLEPCPQCTVGSVINPKINQVFIAEEDAFAGQMLNGRLANLAELWGNMATNIKVHLMQSENPNDVATYLPQDLKKMLTSLFFETKGPLDEHLGNSGFFQVPDLNPTFDLLRG